MDQVQRLFVAFLQEKKIAVTEEQLDRFECYYRTLVEWNQRMNLTAITDREKVYIKHFLDSVSPAFFLPFSSISAMADIGSGAGFPGIPLKILFPRLKLTIVDALQKRIVFLTHLAEKLELEDVALLHARAEDAARRPEHRDRYDLVAARAVARLNVLNELCLPFVRPGGWFVAMKGTDPAEEIREADYSMRLLNAEMKEIFSFTLPVEGADRHLLILEKKGATPPSYPRKPGMPNKEPLVQPSPDHRKMFHVKQKFEK